MPCPICGSDPTDYSCESCKRNICFSCARTVGKSVKCIECLEGHKERQKENKSNLESAFVYSLLLTIGLVIIFLVGDYSIFNLSSTYSNLLPDSVKSMVTLFRGASMLLVLASAAITALLFIASKLQKKPKPEPAK